MDTKKTTTTTPEVRSEERLIPVIRAKLAEQLSREGFHARETAKALNVTQPAVTQYLKGNRGIAMQGFTAIDSLVDPLAEKLVKRIRSGLGGIETAELLETARQVMVMNMGTQIAQTRPDSAKRNESLELLRARLQLELTAAEKYLELANRTSDDHTKLLLRMIASDSIRHGDVVSQVISWLEGGSRSGNATPDESLLRSMLSIEDSAAEASLRKSVEVDHPIARLLLEWIDIDELKHEKMVGKMLGLNRKQHEEGAKS